MESLPLPTCVSQLMCSLLAYIAQFVSHYYAVALRLQSPLLSFVDVPMLAAGGQPPDITSSYTNPPNKRTELLTIHISLTALALLVVALRLVSRYMIVRSPGWDDHAILAAMVSTSMDALQLRVIRC